MAFPTHRLRRLRRREPLRRLVRETRLSAENLVQPLFVCPGEGVARQVPSMPGVCQLSIDRLVEEARAVAATGVPAVILFGLPDSKDAEGSSSWSDQGIVQRALRALAREVPSLVRFADLCFCEYTDHGHCGILAAGEVDNDATLELLGRQAASLARAGAEVLAPSGMMDGMVGAVRRALDAEGFADRAILSYAAKFASGFYGPFREAAGSAPSFGDRSGYQMDPANRREALREVAFDLAEGADIVMVKPALAYLDVIREVRDRFDVPVAAYSVSGEYAMIQAAGRLGWIDAPRVRDEVLLAIRRAGADIILTYFAKEVAASL